MTLHSSGGTSGSVLLAAFPGHRLTVRDAEASSLLGREVEAQTDQGHTVAPRTCVSGGTAPGPALCCPGLFPSGPVMSSLLTPLF